MSVEFGPKFLPSFLTRERLPLGQVLMSWVFTLSQLKPVEIFLEKGLNKSQGL